MAERWTYREAYEDLDRAITEDLAVGIDLRSRRDAAARNLAASAPGDELAGMPLVECPRCGATGPAPEPGGPQMTCSGSFTDRDHPSNVLMVAATDQEEEKERHRADAAEERAEKAEAAFTAAGNRADRAQDRADRANEEIGKLEDALDRAEARAARILSPEAVEAAAKAAHPLWPMYTPGQKLRLREEFKRALQAALNAATDPKETNDGE